jgi:carboxymethylenebutenolidase
VTRRAAAEGFHAEAPDLFHRSGPGAVVEYGDFRKVIGYFQDLGGDAAILRDVDATIAHLRDAGFDDHAIGIIGFCFGGRVTFLTALRRALGAAVGFYGGGIVTARFPQFPPLVGEAAALQTPWLGLFGDRDASIPVEDVERLRTALKDATVEAGIVRYAAAGHGFHCDARPDYRAGEARDAWSRAVGWLRDHLA